MEKVSPSSNPTTSSSERGPLRPSRKADVQRTVQNANATSETPEAKPLLTDRLTLSQALSRLQPPIDPEAKPQSQDAAPAAAPAKPQTYNAKAQTQAQPQVETEGVTPPPRFLIRRSAQTTETPVESLRAQTLKYLMNKPRIAISNKDKIYASTPPKEIAQSEGSRESVDATSEED